jgi:hypothetical protein
MKKTIVELLDYLIIHFSSKFLLFSMETEDGMVNSGEKVTLKPYSGSLNVDFGKGVRTKDVYLL